MEYDDGGQVIVRARHAANAVTLDLIDGDPGRSPPVGRVELFLLADAHAVASESATVDIDAAVHDERVRVGSENGEGVVEVVLRGQLAGFVWARVDGTPYPARSLSEIDVIVHDIGSTPPAWLREAHPKFVDFVEFDQRLFSLGRRADSATMAVVSLSLVTPGGSSTGPSLRIRTNDPDLTTHPSLLHTASSSIYRSIVVRSDEMGVLREVLVMEGNAEIRAEHPPTRRRVDRFSVGMGAT